MSPLVEMSSFPLNSITEHTQSRLSACLFISVLCSFLVLAVFSASFLVGFGLAFAPRRSVFSEAPEGVEPVLCVLAHRVALPLLPFVFAFWWLRLSPRGCSVFVV